MGSRPLFGRYFTGIAISQSQFGARNEPVRKTNHVRQKYTVALNTGVSPIFLWGGVIGGAGYDTCQSDPGKRYGSTVKPHKIYAKREFATANKIWLRAADLPKELPAQRFHFD
jgi:hypothetical protein